MILALATGSLLLKYTRLIELFTLVGCVVPMKVWRLIEYWSVEISVLEKVMT